MKAPEQEYKEALSYLRMKLAQPEPEVESWLNDIVDRWIARRRTMRPKKGHG